MDRPAFSADSKLLAIATHDAQTVKVWDVASGEEVFSAKGAPMSAVALSAEGRLLAAANSDNTISLWDLSIKDPKPRTLAGHSGRIHVLKFTPDAKTLVSSSSDGTIRLWNPDRERAFQESIPLGPPRQRLVFELDPSGQYLFVTGDSPVIFVLQSTRSSGQFRKTEHPTPR